MPGYGSRYWSERTGDSRRPSFPKYRGEIDADAVVIGGGLTGLTAAYVMAKAGLDVVVFEAGRIADGATSAGLGAIVPEPDALFRTVAAAAGIRVARHAWKETHRSALEMAGALRRLSINCDLTPAPLISNARGTEAAALLKKEQAARKAAGVDASAMTGRAATAELGTVSAGALRARDGFTLDSVRAALGLARAATDCGARIFERAEVRKTRFTRKSAEVLLSSGRVRTRHIVVATGGPGRLFGQLRRHVRELDGFAVVTETLGAQMLRASGTHAHVVNEFGDPRWLRWLPDNRALFAGTAARPVPARQREKMTVASTGQLMYELSVRYPVISGLPARWGWHVPIVTTDDGLPWIGSHRNYPFHFFALAFGWHSDALAWLSARAALRQYQGETRREDEGFSFLRHL